MLSEKPWRAEAVIQFIAAQFTCLCLGILAAGLLHKFHAHGFTQDEDFGNILLATLSFQGATWILIPVFLGRHQMHWREAFGFRGPKIKHFLLLALGFIVVFAVVMLLQYLSILTLEKFGFSPEVQPAVKLLSGAKSWWTTVYLGIFAVVLAPVAEEFIFRGVLFPFAKQLGFPKLAWLGVSFLFAAIHFDAVIFVPLFVLALALTWLYEYTDNLLAPIAAHALFNMANLAALFFFQNKIGN